jgi:hypothetical protein
VSFRLPDLYEFTVDVDFLNLELSLFQAVCIKAIGGVPLSSTEEVSTPLGT